MDERHRNQAGPREPSATVNALFDRACALLRAGDQRANALLPQLQAHPHHAKGWLALGRVLAEQDQRDAALMAFEQALSSPAPPLAAAFEKADLLITAGHSAAAIEWLESLARRNAGDVRIGHRLGRAYYAVGNLDKARRCLQDVVDSAPDFAEAWFHLGLVEQDRGEPAAAAEAYRAALSQQPRLFEAALNLGISLQDTGAIEPALDAYARAVDIEPACFNRVAQALTSGSTGRLWLDPQGLRRSLAARA